MPRFIDNHFKLQTFSFHVVDIYWHSSSLQYWYLPGRLESWAGAGPLIGWGSPLVKLNIECQSFICSDNELGCRVKHHCILAIVASDQATCFWWNHKMVPSWRLKLLQRMQSELAIVRAECSAATFFTILHILRTTAAAAPVPGNAAPQPSNYQHQKLWNWMSGISAFHPHRPRRIESCTTFLSKM